MIYDANKPGAENKSGVKMTNKTYTVAAPKDSSHCEGCPYPGVGFICWDRDGSCMKTDMDKINRRKKGR